MTRKRAFQFSAGILGLFVILSLGSSQEIVTQPQIETMADLEALFPFEPGYGQIQQAAMRYAEVHPDKIAAWRQGASLRAFLPEVTFSYNLDKDFEFETSTDFETSLETSYSTGYEEKFEDKEGYKRQFGEKWDSTAPGDVSWSLTEEWTSEVKSEWSTEEAWGEKSGEQSSLGESEKRGKDRDWGIKLEWDLREFLFSREQIYISKEARELVELRQDVVEEVMTYFFDRRRAQTQMLFSPPSDARSVIDLQLRIARLTASIDALTGGYLSKKLEEAKAAK